MSDRMSSHEPTPEFRASLEREIARAFRSETQFGHAQRTRRLGMVAGMAAGAVGMLTIGLVLGVRTGYASAEGLDERQRAATPHSPLDILRAVPVRSALSVLTCGQTAAAPKVAPIQKGIPLIDLPPASAKAAETFGAILGIHQAGDGKVLVNDAVRRQIKLFDSTLATATIVRDSAPGSATSYGPRPAPLIPYLGDSSLFADWNSRTMLVLDSRGQVAHALALPDPRNMVSINNGYAAVDPKGRLILRGPRQPVRTTPAPPLDYADSQMVLRLDLDLRRTDTIGGVNRPLMKVVTEKSSDGKTSTIYALDPLQSDDDWALMSDGTIAFVRGHDYHIDWVHLDGSVTSTPKLPFTWKRLTDDDKTRLADSLRAAQNPLLANGYPSAEISLRAPCGPVQTGPAGGGDGRGRAGSGGRGTSDAAAAEALADPRCVEIVASAVAPGMQIGTRPPRPPLLDLIRGNPIFDYEAPIRVNSTMADPDGNVWILPRTSSLSRNGELVYDVVNLKGELFERVRLPVGRAIAGFGKGGVVYLTSGDRSSGFTLERTTLSAKK
jgi:hypothetical protein